MKRGCFCDIVNINKECSTVASLDSRDYSRPTLASVSPGTEQTTFLMYTERALSCHTRNRFMLTNLACPN